MTSRSAPSPRASRAEAWSLSITASMPSKRPSRRTTGMPPPPHAIASVPAASSARIGFELDDLERLGGGDDPPPAAARVRLAASSRGRARAPPPASAAIERPDRLRRVRRRRGRRGVHDDVRAATQATGRSATGRELRRRSARRSPPASARRRRQSGSGGASSAARSWRRSSFPTCGPFPCVITTWRLRAAARRRRTSSRRFARCSAAVPRSPGPMSAFPPRATTVSTEPHLSSRAKHESPEFAAGRDGSSLRACSGERGARFDDAAGLEDLVSVGSPSSCRRYVTRRAGLSMLDHACAGRSASR